MSRRQRMMLQLFKFVSRWHVPKLLSSMMIEDCARLLLCANMMDSLLRRRHGHRTHADVATRHLLLLHDGVILLRGNLLNLRGRYAGLGHGLLDRLIQLVKLLHF